MTSLRYMLFLIMVGPLGCGGGTGDDDGGYGPHHGDSGSKDSGASGTFLSAVEVLNPRDNASDITVRDDGILYSTQYDPGVYFWTPDLEVPEKDAWDLGDLQGIAMADGALLATFSDSGVVGWVSRIEAPKTQIEWADKADNGTLFRRPKDLVSFEGALFVVDEKLGTLWKLAGEGGAVTAAYAAEGLSCVGVWGGELYVAQTSGVIRVGGEQVDTRQASALGVVSGKLYGAHVEHGIFEIGAPDRQWALPDLARPGPFVEYQGSIYMVDAVGGAIWRLDELP